MNLFGPSGRVARIYPTGAMVLWLAIILGATLAVNLLDISRSGSL